MIKSLIMVGAGILLADFGFNLRNPLTWIILVALAFLLQRVDS